MSAFADFVAHINSMAPDGATTQAAPPDSDNVPAVPEENLSVSPDPAAPACDPGQDAMAESSEPAAPADPPPADAPDNVCVPGDDSLSSLLPDQTTAAELASLPADDQMMLNLGGPETLRSYQEGKASAAETQRKLREGEQLSKDIHADREREIVEANRIYQATGQIPQTTHNFAWVEIKEGRQMTQAERMDAMLKAQGKTHPEMDDIVQDNRDPAYLTKEEFQDEFRNRHQAEWDQCDADHWFRGPTYRCQEGVDEKYGGESFKAWDKERSQRRLREIQAVANNIEGVASSGPTSLAGRVVGSIVDHAIGDGTREWEEKLAVVGGLIDNGVLPAVAGGKAMKRTSGGGGGGGGGGDGGGEGGGGEGGGDPPPEPTSGTPPVSPTERAAQIQAEIDDLRAVRQATQEELDLANQAATDLINVTLNNPPSARDYPQQLGRHPAETRTLLENIRDNPAIHGNEAASNADGLLTEIARLEEINQRMQARVYELSEERQRLRRRN
jgi:hypothetical protein